MMQQVTRQLEEVRRLARWLLLTQRLLQWMAALIAIGLALGVIDFALRLPAWLRLAIGLAVAAVAGVWLATRMWRASRFWPPLSELALRAERIYPHLAGAFASAVDFTEHAEAYRSPDRTAALTGASVDAATGRLHGVHLRRLLDVSPTVRLFAVWVLAVTALTAVVVYAPYASAVATARWFMPLGDAQWPKRTGVEPLVLEGVWPVDTPLRLAAHVRRGYAPGMRVEVHYRVVDATGDAGPWQTRLMTEQTDGRGRFERLIEAPPTVARAIIADPDRAAAVEYRFEAGDDTSDILSVPMVARPAVRRVALAVEPPTYAAGLVTPQDIALHEQNTVVATAAALAGSTLTLDVTLNKPVPIVALADAAPGLPGAQLAPVRDGSAAPTEAAAADRFTLRMVLTESVETPLRLVDRFGLGNLSERRYRVEAIEDRPPTVALLEPSADISVLPTAVVPVAALAQDDVGVQRLNIDAQVPAPPTASASDQTMSTRVLAERTARQATVDTRATLELEPLDLRPGQVVMLHATASDVFELDGATHDAVRSPPRRLRIIDEATLIGQIRTELAALRQQAVRLEQNQRTLVESPPANAAGQQAQLTQRVRAQHALVDAQQQRVTMNRLEEPTLEELLTEAAGLLDEAERASAQAERALEGPEPQAATPAQTQAAQALDDLATLLDQGRTAQALQMALRQLQVQESAIAQDTRELLPQTIGREAQELSESQREQLDELAERQRQLAEQAEAMVRQMQTAAESLSRQGETDREQAAAAALSEAAAIAQRQGLRQQMDRAAAATEQNQLSQAGSEQNQSLDTIGQMLQQMQEQDELRQAMLQRRLAQLKQLLQRLIERQTAEIARLDAAAALPPLEPALAQLRRNTMAALDRAEASEDTAAAGEPIGAAVSAQGEAIVALRADDRPPAAEAEGQSLASLEAALALLEELERQAQQEQADQQRDELREAYEALAAREEQLIEQTADFAEAGPVTRKQRAALLGLSQDQSQLRDEADALREQVAQTLVFKRLHRRIDEAANRAANGLRRGVADAEVLNDQRQVAGLLRTMAAALEEDRQDSEFVEGQQAGGAGGGGGGQPQVIPPMAELKLLRGVQASLYEATRGLEPGGGAKIRQRLLELSTQQRELSELGQALVEQMQQAQQPLPPPPEAPSPQ